MLPLISWCTCIEMSVDRLCYMSTVFKHWLPGMFFFRAQMQINYILIITKCRVVEVGDLISLWWLSRSKRPCIMSLPVLVFHHLLYLGVHNDNLIHNEAANNWKLVPNRLSWNSGLQYSKHPDKPPICVIHNSQIIHVALTARWKYNQYLDLNCINEPFESVLQYKY